MNVTLPNGQTITGIPDGTPKEVIKQKAISAGLATPEDFIQAASPTNANQPAPIDNTLETDPLSLIPGMEESTVQPAEPTTITEDIIGAGETALTLGTGAVGGTAGMVGGFLSGVANELRKGNFGTDEAADRIEQAAMGGAESLTYAPRTRAGQEQTEAVGRIAQATIPTAGLAGEIGAIASGAARSAVPAARTVSRNIKNLEGRDIVTAGEKAGVPVLTSDVRPPQTFAGKMSQQTGEKIPLAGTGAVREQQQIMRENAVANFADKYSQFSYDEIAKSLKDRKEKVKRAAGSVLESTGGKLDDLGEIPVDNTKNAIQSVKAELNKPGVIQSTGAIEDLQTLINVLDESPQSFTTLKENRTAFREIVQGADKAERSQLTSRAKSLLQRVESAMKKDMDSFAKENLTESEFGKWQRANSVYASEASKMTKTKLKGILDKGDVTPESVNTMLFSQKPSEIKLLYDSLTSSGKQNARAAIISKAINNLSKRQSGITPNSFASEMKKLGIQTNVFFKGKEKSALTGLLKVLEATRRAQEAGVVTPTGQQLLGAGTVGAAVIDLGATVGLGGTLGGFARLYESAPIRNALLRVSSAPKGSLKLRNSLQDAQLLIAADVQAARQAGQDTELPQE